MRNMGGDIIPPIINAQLLYLLTNSPFSIKVEQMWSGSRNPALLDRFTLLVPFCLDYVKWNVIYNAQHPLIAPDVIFGPEDDGFRPFHGDGDTKLKNNSLSDWNYKDPTRLLSLILELRDAYTAYQKRRVAEVDDERVKFETSTVISKEGIEMYVSSGVDKSEEVRFAVPLLGMDINKVVVGSTWRQPQKIYLQVIFSVARKFSATPSAPRLKLVSSPEMKALFSTDDFRLPPWLDGMCMAEYLPTLEDLLALQIRDAVFSIEVRRKFIVALAPVFGRPVEADPVFCRKATFLVASGVFSCLVHFTLPNHFPKQKPLLVLQSSQHFDSRGAPIKSALLTEYPWSPRWEAPEMAERIFDFLVEECLNFKKYCTETVLHQR